MENKLTKKYGLFTAICMVVGIVIGSGVFFKAQDVLQATAGDALMGVLAWLIGGAVMAVCAVTFGVMATKYEKVGGVVDYAEATLGKGYAYYIGWFMSMVYYPAMTSVLAWVSARYTIVAVRGVSSTSADALFGSECITLAAVYLIVIFVMNALAPKLAGKFQVSTTVIKFVPIVGIALIGTIVGLVNGTLVDNFTHISTQLGEVFIPDNPGTDKVDETVLVGAGNLFTAVCGTVFAYEGWIIATAVNAEIKDAKKNLPFALGIGAAVIVGAYVLYYIGVLGLGNIVDLGNQGTTAAFNFFLPAIAAIINFLIVISCLGTLNGLMLGCTRGFYAIAARNEGFAPDTISEVDKKTNMPTNAAVVALLVCGAWFAYFIGGQFFGWFGDFAFDSSELPIVTVYPMYVPILISFMIKADDVHPFKRFVLPSLSIVGVIIFVIASIFKHTWSNLWYLIVFAVIMGVGALFHKNGGKSLMDKFFDLFKKEEPKEEAEASENVEA